MSQASMILRTVISILLGILTVSVFFVGEVIPGEILLLVTLYVSPLGPKFCEKHNFNIPTSAVSTVTISVLLVIFAAICTAVTINADSKSDNVVGIEDESIALSPDATTE